MLSDDYEQEQEELRGTLLLLGEEITKQEEQAENIDRFIGKVRKYLDLEELTPTILAVNSISSLFFMTRQPSASIISSPILTENPCLGSCLYSARRNCALTLYAISLGLNGFVT